MNRQIKFRAWDAHHKKMYHKGNGLSTILSTGEVRTIVMQYTGLKDKNGTEIYEGDIIIQRDVKEDVGVIYYEKGIYKIKWYKHCIAPENYAINFRLYVWGEEELEVIGNIYEHPHLLDN